MAALSPDPRAADGSSGGPAGSDGVASSDGDGDGFSDGSSVASVAALDGPEAMGAGSGFSEHAETESSVRATVQATPAERADIPLRARPSLIMTSPVLRVRQLRVPVVRRGSAIVTPPGRGGRESDPGLWETSSSPDEPRPVDGYWARPARAAPDVQE